MSVDEYIEQYGKMEVKKHFNVSHNSVRQSLAESHNLVSEKMKQKLLSAQVYESHKTFSDGTFASPKGKNMRIDNTRTSMALENIRDSFLSPDNRKSTVLLSEGQTSARSQRGTTTGTNKKKKQIVF